MSRLEETEISRAILCAYHEKLLDRIASDVLIVGAGASGMMAGVCLARKGLKVTLLEKRLTPGGGVWGGGMGMCEAVVQKDPLHLLDQIGVRYEPRGDDLYVVGAIELAAGLCVKAIQAGAALFNLTMAEDLCVRGGRVTGVVVNRTMIAEELPIDPFTFSARAVVDATGHEAAVVECLRKRNLLASPHTD